MAEEAKVNKYDVSALKQSLDDAVIKYVTDTLEYQEDHFLSNIKLVLGALGCVLAVVAHFYPTPFPANKNILIPCAACYFISSGILQYIAYLQQDVILFTKPAKARKALEISSRMNKFDPKYTLTIKYKGGKSHAAFTKPVTEWFTAEGELVDFVFSKQVKLALSQLEAKKE